MSSIQTDGPKGKIFLDSQDFVILATKTTLDLFITFSENLCALKICVTITIIIIITLIKIFLNFHRSNITIGKWKSLSCGQLFVTPMDCNAPGFPVHHQLPELAQIHVHQVGDAIQPSQSCHPLLFLLSIFPSTRVFSNESILHIRWPNYWSFSFKSVFPMTIQDWFPLGWTGLISLQSKVLSRVFSNNSKTSVLQCSAFFMIHLSHTYMTTGKTVALTIWTFVSKVISMLFNMLSSFVIAFLPRSSHLLTSWLQSTSALILEPKKIKSFTVSIASPSIYPEVMGLDATILVLLSVEF